MKADSGSGCTSRFLVMEQALNEEYKKARNQGETNKRLNFADFCGFRKNSKTGPSAKLIPRENF